MSRLPIAQVVLILFKLGIAAGSCYVYHPIYDTEILTSYPGFLGHFDFIYSLPSAWLCVPFTFLGKVFRCSTCLSTHMRTLGIIAEAGSSVNFIERSTPSLPGLH